jgi:hypothetical protein
MEGDQFLPRLSDSSPPHPLPPREGVILLVSRSSLSLEWRGLARLRRVKVRVIHPLGLENAPRKALSASVLE